MATRKRALTEVGYIKYTGEDAERGVIDAGSAGSALLGLDETLRYFNTQQSPDFASLDYDIPVQTRSGSWEAVVLGALATAGVVGAAFATGYAKKAGEKIAENDFKDVTMKQVLQKSMSALKTLAKVVKHTRQARGWENARFAMEGQDAQIMLLNDKGEELLVPAEFFRWYRDMPPRLLMRMTSVVRTKRVLHIGMSGDTGTDEVVVTEREKSLFDEAPDDDNDGEQLFPELVHGQTVDLEGRLIRGSEASNSVGLEYQGHIVNCVPAKGNVRQYKLALFLHCKVSGRVNRHAKNRFVADRRPTIILDRVVPLERDVQGSLFDA